MKTLSYLIILVSLTILISCNKNDTDEYPNPNPNVEKYIELLKSNQYDSLNPPAFTYIDTPV